MLKFIAGLVAGVVLLGLVTHISRGQGTTVNVRGREIKQGDPLTIDLTIDKASNLEGSVTIGAAPDGGAVEISFGCRVPTGTKTCHAETGVPLNAKPGKWSITKLAFQPIAGGLEKELTKRGDVSFQIVARTDVIEPDSATVTEIK